MSATVHGFQTEVTKLLNLLANSLYSNKEVFLRELISNASDAIDKLHFLSLTNPDLIKDDPNFHIRIRADKELKTLTISDNGIGMTLEEANAHLGTIAKSGTEEFVKNLSGDQAKDSQLIGQFGVGFYSSFIVADRVTVISRSAQASAAEGVRWTSDGSGTFESENIDVPNRGTQIILHLKDSEEQFLDAYTLRSAITKYSDHISTPVEVYQEVFDKDDDENKESNDQPKEPKFDFVQINEAKALWTRTPKDVSDDEYKSFFKHAFSEYADPLNWAHNKVEGELEYTSLLYIPSTAPFNLMYRDQLNGIKLYIQRIFIMDDAEQFMPKYLRFMRGLVDTNALPLNVSREILQENKITNKLKRALTKRALGLIEALSKDKEKYKTFTHNFNDVIKEGLSDDMSNQEKILKLIRFASTYDTDPSCNVSLDDYISRMLDKQENIYYLCADDYEKAVNNPALEALKAKGIEVLLLWKQPIDKWICSYLNKYQDKKFINANSEDLELGDLQNEEEKSKYQEMAETNKDLVERFKSTLGQAVTDVRVSSRLTTSPACVVIKDGGFSSQMRFLAMMQGSELPENQYILELNPQHELIEKAAHEQDANKFADWAKLILQQAILAEEGTLKNPSEFSELVCRMLLGKTIVQEAKTVDNVETVDAEVIENTSSKSF